MSTYIVSVDFSSCRAVRIETKYLLGIHLLTPFLLGYIKVVNESASCQIITPHFSGVLPMMRHQYNSHSTKTTGGVPMENRTAEASKLESFVPSVSTRKTTHQKHFNEEPIAFRFRIEPALDERIRLNAVKNRNSLCLEIHLLIEKNLEEAGAET
jgi:hypothetical protein